MIEDANAETPLPKPEAPVYAATDWENFKIFLAVARQGGIVRAAAELGVGQATVSRRLAQLERDLGVRLLDRAAGGARPSAEGLRILDLLSSAEQSLSRAAGRIASSAGRLTGDLTMIVTEGLGSLWLPPLFGWYRRRHPDVSLRTDATLAGLVASSGPVDVALSLIEPTDPTIVSLRLGTIHLVPTASRAYVAERGRPASLAGFAEHDLIDIAALALGRGSWPARLAEAGAPGTRSLLCGSQSLALELALGGHGVAMLPTYAPLAKPELTAVAAEPNFPARFWLAFRRDAAEQPHVRAMIDALKAAFDRSRFPWFADEFVAPEPETVERWRAIHRDATRELFG